MGILMINSGVKKSMNIKRHFEEERMSYLKDASIFFY